MIRHTADSLIPAPQNVRKQDGAFPLLTLKNFYITPEFGSLSARLDGIFGKFKLACRRVDIPTDAQCILKKSLLPREGFRITITEKSILLEAADYGGAFYAVNALAQMLFTAAGL